MPTMSRYWYAYGFASKEAAQDVLDDMFAAGEVSNGEAPEIKTYVNGNNAVRYGITLNG